MRRSRSVAAGLGARPTGEPDGSVWLSHMNIAMMSRFMDGVVGEAMGVVARADGAFMSRILG